MIADTGPEPRKKSRAWLVVLAVLLAAGAGALAVVLATRPATSRADAGVVAVAVTRDAAPAPVDATTGKIDADDNPEVADVPAEDLIDDALANQIDDALSGQAPVDAGKAKGATVPRMNQKQAKDLANAAEQSAMDMAKAECAQMQRPELAQMMKSYGEDGAMLQGVCACITGDAAAARAVFAKLTRPGDKRSMVGPCKQKGISLP